MKPETVNITWEPLLLLACCQNCEVGIFFSTRIPIYFIVKYVIPFTIYVSGT